MIGIDTGYERLLGAGCSYYRPKPQALRIDQAR